MKSPIVFVTVAAMIVFVGCAGRAVVEAEPDGGAAGSGGDGGAPLVDAGVEDASFDDASTTDGGPEPLCPMDGAVTAAVSGMTPLGSIDLPYAWMGFLNGECGGLHVALSAVHSFDPVSMPPAPSLRFYRTEVDPMTGYLGGAEADVTVEVNGQYASAKGWLELTRADPMPDGPIGEGMEYPRTEGTVTIDAPGWSVAGSFTALYCDGMDIYCP
ncbi:hypothetical protein [Polyangium sp. y55x31]|uniref:hypothetical protein n=1 Tax=Polyangium sp. y55x31 TaxID=3042688 RepID=UPI002482644B|nr:hypothetical protein [Polyangium sp. y55x31]MDI1480120.1 hypothetical protein [Polyangium sp. y55x31]